MPHPDLAIWMIAACAMASVILRPFDWPEAIWAVAGAGLLIALRLMPPGAALVATAKGTDVYLFLAGMMVLSELARSEGLFDWLAARAVHAARGSATRLFFLIYGVGVGVTTILSNDATAVVLTPAVFAATKRARVDPLPYLFICALVANAASFVLPISNPANLVVYDGHMPDLASWLAKFLLPSLLAIGATYFALRWAERDRLSLTCDPKPEIPVLTRGGMITFAAIALTAIVLVAASIRGLALGLTTAIMACATTAVVFLAQRTSPWPLLRQMTWSIIPLVAGLFVLIEAVAKTGAIDALTHALDVASAASGSKIAGAAGLVVALAANLMNNLPVGLIAGSALAHQSRRVIDCVLIGVDLGPNLSVSGSLATILWLAVIRREGEDVTYWRFLKVGAVVMPPALLLAIMCRLLLG